MLFHHLAFASCAALVIAGGLTAQHTHMSSSPRGFEMTEGNSSIDLIGSQAQLRFQQIDATSAAKMIATMAFRRDGAAATNAAYGARTVDMEVDMGFGAVAFAGAHMPGNYVGTPTTVLNRKQVSFPDWVQAPTAPPAMPNLMIPLDTMFSYPGVSGAGTDFLWEVRVYSTSSTAGYPMDADGGVPSTWFEDGVSLGVPGCIPTNGSQPTTLQTQFANWSSHFAADFHVNHSVASSPTLLFLGPSDSALALPNLCSTLHVLPAAPGVSVPVGNTDSTGHLHYRIDPIGYNASVIGVPVYAQAATLDSGVQKPKLPLTLTDGVRTAFPVDPPTFPQVVHMYTTRSATFHHSGGVVNGGVILLTSHQ